MSSSSALAMRASKPPMQLLCWAQNGRLYHESGRHRQYALQPQHRRHCQGHAGAGGGRAGRRDGSGGRRHLPAKPDAEQGQRPRRARAAGADRPPPLQRIHEARAGTDPGSGYPSGRGGGAGSRGRPCEGRCHPAARRSTPPSAWCWPPVRTSAAKFLWAMRGMLPARTGCTPPTP